MSLYKQRPGLGPMLSELRFDVVAADTNGYLPLAWGLLKHGFAVAALIQNRLLTSGFRRLMSITETWHHAGEEAYGDKHV